MSSQKVKQLPKTSIHLSSHSEKSTTALESLKKATKSIANLNSNVHTNENSMSPYKRNFNKNSNSHTKMKKIINPIISQEMHFNEQILNVLYIFNQTDKKTIKRRTESSHAPTTQQNYHHNNLSKFITEIKRKFKEYHHLHNFTKTASNSDQTLHSLIHEFENMMMKLCLNFTFQLETMMEIHENQIITLQKAVDEQYMVQLTKMTQRSKRNEEYLLRQIDSLRKRGVFANKILNELSCNGIVNFQQFISVSKLYKEQVKEQMEQYEIEKFDMMYERHNRRFQSQGKAYQGVNKMKVQQKSNSSIKK